ncbi:MAG: hypothetical protein H6Q17_2897 [Bacteroidetes bacterium]|nr:hypothetical protein [Bacteroidota bacterium]
METEQKEISEIWTFVHSFMEIYRKEKDKLPYHINVIDLLHANENAHSRILMKLLQFNKHGQFEILQSFLDYFSFDLKIENPTITAEKDRIDLLVDDKKFAVIIENKIHGATDQHEQIKRYIESVSTRHPKEHIYVLYLIRDEGKDVEAQSWGEYKQSFAERFRIVSYRDDILPWLKDTVMPECRTKDVYLLSAIEQYIDHLDGLFNTRKIHTKMNEQLQNYIRKEIGLGESPEKNHEPLKNAIKEFDNVRNQLQSLKDQTEKECWNKWKNRLSKDFPSYEIVDKINDKRFPKVGVNLVYHNWHFAILIEKESNIYYGIGRHYSSDKIEEELKDILKPVLDGFKESTWWYGWKYTSFENAYKRLVDLIIEVEDLLKTQK